MGKWIRWVPAIFWMAGIFYLSSRTGDELNSLLPFFQQWFPGMESFNWGHFAAYFVLALTFYWGLGNYHWSGKATCVLLCILYGLTDEFHQSFVSNRAPDIMDLRNDVIGAGLAMLFASLRFVQYIIRRLDNSIKY